MELVKDFIKFAMLGVTIEVIFTALSDVYKSFKDKSPIHWQLKGQSYLWMIPIYGSISFFARALFPIFGSYNVFLRTFVYALVILMVEYLSGYMIKKVTGKCPWHYESKYAIHHLIRIDYIPFWMLFSYIAESYYRYF